MSGSGPTYLLQLGGQGEFGTKQGEKYPKQGPIWGDILRLKKNLLNVPTYRVLNSSIQGLGFLPSEGDADAMPRLQVTHGPATKGHYEGT